MTKALTIFAIATVLCTCSALPIDRSMAAVDGNDLTIVFSQDQKISRQYVFVQVSEGSDGAVQMGMVVEPVACKEAACIRYQFFGKDNSPLPLAGGIPKGQTQVSFQLKDIIPHAPPITAADDGEYWVEQLVFYADADGLEHSFQRRGFVRLNVLDPKYRAIGCNDPAVAWATRVAKGRDCLAQFTTAGRTALCGKECD